MLAKYSENVSSTNDFVLFVHISPDVSIVVYVLLNVLCLVFDIKVLSSVFALTLDLQLMSLCDILIATP